VSNNRHVRLSLLVALAFMLVFGATAAGRTGEQAARPRTLAQVRGSIDALAQNGRRIAWCGRHVQILTLPGRRPVDVGSRRGRCARAYSSMLNAIALSADGRVLWQGVAEEANTYFVIDLFTAALRHPRTRLVTHTNFVKDSDPDFGREPKPLPMAGDGKAILFYASCDAEECPGSLGQSAIYRLAARRSSRLAEVAGSLGRIGLAVSGRRFTVVTNSFRCCSSTPAWSHDGTRLAWIYAGDLWTIRADGTGDRQLAAGVGWSPDDARRPSWSPDDARLVFDRADAHGRRRVYRVDATGGGLRRLAVGAAPAWSPDGTKIAFMRGRALFSINPGGTGARRLTATARATAGPLSWSPDSTRIAVSRGGDIYSVRADGSGETRLTSTGRPETQPAWSPDGAQIAYVDGSMIAVVNADGTGATRLTRASESDRSPAWSPDSTRIAFVRRILGSSISDLWVMNADGSGQRRTPATGDSPQWAPDGSTIVVGDWCAGLREWPCDTGIHLVSPIDGKTRKIAPLLHSTVEIGDALTGRLIKRFTIGGHTHATALGPDYIALLVHHEPGVRIELYNLNGSFGIGADVPGSVRSLSAAGRTVVFATGRVIRRLDARTGAVTALATAGGTPVGLTIEGRRVAWAENGRGGARIRAFTAP
jgi:Tol biopolymer transport system component